MSHSEMLQKLSPLVEFAQSLETSQAENGDSPLEVPQRLHCVPQKFLEN